MKSLSFATVFFTLTAPIWAVDLMTEPMEAVIKEIMANPSYHQMCGGAEFEGRSVPLPIYGRLLGREFGIREGQLKVLLARRAELVPALKTALSKLHPENGRSADNLYAADQRSARPDQFNALYLFIVSDCHVIEAIPELLDLEERLRGAIQFADEHPKSPLPDVAWDGGIFHPRKANVPVREKFLDFCRADQRDILSLILRLLREQRFEPLLASSFESKFREGAARREKEWESQGLKDDEQRGEASNSRDPEALVPFDGDRYYVTIPFNAKTRNEVRSLAQQFLETVPPEKWKHLR